VAQASFSIAPRSHLLLAAILLACAKLTEPLLRMAQATFSSGPRSHLVPAARGIPFMAQATFSNGLRSHLVLNILAAGRGSHRLE
jgi:hypothetical protein